jgi:hypothetical protein
MNTIHDYFLNAQLSLAAYTDFNGNYDSTNVVTQLMAEKGFIGFSSPDFTATSAQNFVNQFARTTRDGAQLKSPNDISQTGVEPCHVVHG